MYLPSNAKKSTATGRAEYPSLSLVQFSTRAAHRHSHAVARGLVAAVTTGRVRDVAELHIGASVPTHSSCHSINKTKQELSVCSWMSLVLSPYLLSISFTASLSQIWWCGSGLEPRRHQRNYGSRLVVDETVATCSELAAVRIWWRWYHGLSMVLGSASRSIPGSMTFFESLIIFQRQACSTLVPPLLNHD